MDWENIILGILITVLSLFAIGLIGTLGAMGFDEIQDRRAFARTTACEARQMVPRRQWLTTNVVCVPAINRRDTTALQVSGT